MKHSVALPFFFFFLFSTQAFGFYLCHTFPYLRSLLSLSVEENPNTCCMQPFDKKQKQKVKLKEQGGRCYRKLALPIPLGITTNGRALHFVF